MSSGSETTTSSSKIRQFGLYRTIDSRTEEFLKLSRQRQIRQGCACAAVSTIITITIVVSVVLVYDLSKDSDISRRKLNNLQWLENVNDTDMTLFDEKYNKANFNVDRASLKILPVILKALNKNAFLEQLIEEDTSASPQETTEFVYEKNVFSDVRNWLKLPSKLYTIEYKPPPFVYFKKTDNNYLTKIRKIRDYHKRFFERHMERKIIILNDKKQEIIDPSISVTESEYKTNYESTSKTDVKEKDKKHINTPVINFALDETSPFSTDVPTTSPMTTYLNEINTSTTTSTPTIATVTQKPCKCPKNVGEIINKIVSGFRIIMPKLLNIKHKCVQPQYEYEKKYSQYEKQLKATAMDDVPKTVTDKYNLSVVDFMERHKDIQNNHATAENQPIGEENYLLYEKQLKATTMNDVPKSVTNNYNMSLVDFMQLHKDSQKNHITGESQPLYSSTKPISTTHEINYFDYGSNYDSGSSKKNNKMENDQMKEKYPQNHIIIFKSTTLEPSYLDYDRNIRDVPTQKTSPVSEIKDQQTKEKPEFEDDNEELSFSTSMPFTLDTNSNTQAVKNTAALKTTKAVEYTAALSKQSERLNQWFRQYKPLSTPFWSKYMAERKLTTPSYVNVQNRLSVTTEDIKMNFVTSTSTNAPTTVPKVTQKLRIEIKTDSVPTAPIFNHKKMKPTFEPRANDENKQNKNIGATTANRSYRVFKVERTETTKQIGDILLPSLKQMQNKYTYKNKTNSEVNNKPGKHNLTLLKGTNKNFITIKTKTPEIQQNVEDKQTNNLFRLEDAVIAERLDRNEELFDYDLTQSFFPKDDSIAKYPILPYRPDAIESPTAYAQSLHNAIETLNVDPNLAHYAPGMKNMDDLPSVDFETIQSLTSFEPKKHSYLEINNRHDWKKEEGTDFDEY